MMCNRRGKIGIRNRQCHQNKPSTTYLFCRSSQDIAIQRTRNSVFLQDIHTELTCPEYNGFNTRRYVGQPPCFLNPRLTLLSYHLLTPPPPPLLTMTPLRLKLISGFHLESSCDDFLIFTADKQL